jgi:hypothetical protein
MSKYKNPYKLGICQSTTTIRSSKTTSYGCCTLKCTKFIGVVVLWHVPSLKGLLYFDMYQVYRGCFGHDLMVVVLWDVSNL